MEDPRKMGENTIQKRVEGAAVHQSEGLNLETRGQKVKMAWQGWMGKGGPREFPPMPGGLDEVTGNVTLSV